MALDGLHSEQAHRQWDGCGSGSSPASEAAQSLHMDQHSLGESPELPSCQHRLCEERASWNPTTGEVGHQGTVKLRE